MADKTYRLTFKMTDGTEQSVEFTAPQGPKGDTGSSGEGVSSIESLVVNGVSYDGSELVDLTDTIDGMINSRLGEKAAAEHTHTLSELTDYTVDTELSSTSSNPIANSAVNARLVAIEDNIDVLTTQSGTHTYIGMTEPGSGPTMWFDTANANE